MPRPISRAMLLSIVTVASSTAMAQFMPPNDLHLQDSLTAEHNISRIQFDAVLDQVEKRYKPLIKENFNADLILRRQWNNSTVNAYADQHGDQWEVVMFGGLARRHEVTADGFMAVVCHELGHHLAGYPFAEWAGNEGQSDYFSTLACLRQLWEEEPEVNATFKAVVPQLPKSQCDKAWTSESDRHLCYRAMMAGKSLADLLSGGTARFDTPDRSRVTRTDHNHPEGQCRLDTYVAGALCNATFDSAVIPGKTGGTGRNSVASEQQATAASCHAANGDVTGLRPRCWFKPLLN